MGTTLGDFARGGRLFATQPGYAWAAVLTLALAIGANTVIFGVANVLVVKPLPMRDAGRLGWILGSAPGSVPDRAGVSLPEYVAFRDQADVLTRPGAWRWQPVTIRSGDQTERGLALRVIGDIQGLWGLQAVRGRTLGPDDERAGAVPVTVLSHQFWRARFGGAETAVGQSLTIEGQPHRIVGVLAPDIELGNLADIDVWLPVTSDPALAPRHERGWRPVGRLREGATLGDAEVQVTAIARRLAEASPDVSRDWTVRVGSTRDALGGTNTWLVLGLLALVVGLLLVLACANVMNLLIARLIGRRHELAVRAALGATRGRVVRQVVAESLTLGLAGGVVGLAIGWAGLQAVHAVAAEPFFRQIAIDWRVVTFAVGLSFVAPLLFSVLPTLRVLGDDVRDTLSEGTTRTIGGMAAARGRSALVVVQVSLAVTLLIVAALVVQSMQAIVNADPGYDVPRLLTGRVDVATWHVADEDEALRLRQRLIARLDRLPAVQGVALASVVPALQFAPMVTFGIGGRPPVEERDRPRAGLHVVTPGYFEVVGLPLMAGRGLEAADRSSQAAVAVVSAETARRYWSDPTLALGATIHVAAVDGAPTVATVVGVARDPANPDLDQAPTPLLFVLDDHRPSRTMQLLVRAEQPERLAAAVRLAAADVDPDLPVSDLRTLDAAFADEHSSSRLLSGLFMAFAGVAILLATGGLYGVMSHAVSQRGPEIAIRLALGASGRAIAGQVVGHSLRLAASGALVGLVCAYALARAIASLLYGVTATDAETYLGALVTILVASVLAAWMPMRRAAAIDPLERLRRG